MRPFRLMEPIILTQRSGRSIHIVEGRSPALWYAWEEPEPRDQPKGDFTESKRKSLKVRIKKETEEAMEEKKGVKEAG